MFDVERFIADCRDAATASASQGVLEAVAKAVTTPPEVLQALGEPRRAAVQVLHRSAEMTVFNLIWGPRGSMPQLPTALSLVPVESYARREELERPSEWPSVVSQPTA